MNDVGTISMGVKLPILKEGDDLIDAIINSMTDASKETGFPIEYRDVIAVTESIVARTQGDYVTVDEIVESIKKIFNHDVYDKNAKLDTITLYQPVLSRNRFAIILRAIARASNNVRIVFTCPTDEVGNEIVPRDWYIENNDGSYEFEGLVIDKAHNFTHPFTHIKYVKYYGDIIEEEGAKALFMYANEFDLQSLILEPRNILVCNVHDRDIIKRNILALPTLYKNKNVFTLQDICSDKCEWGLLGSNKVDEETVKLFPSNSGLFVEKLQSTIKEKSNVDVECMIYGDGGFKCPVSGIWEELDPVISPAYTNGLRFTPNEIKLKYFADDKFKDMRGEELTKAIKDEIIGKMLSSVTLYDSMKAQGTTPRIYSDLLGSLADLTSGSGDKGTPVVWIKNYFNNYAL